MSFTVPKLAVRDSFDDDDVSDEVEDEVFIRDGRNGFKLDEERGVKRPLMAPRRKFKPTPLHNDVPKTRKYKIFCIPCVYGLIALTALLGLIMLVVFIVTWFPVSLDQITFFQITKTADLNSKLIPCIDLVTEDVWVKSFPKLTSDSIIQLNDINKDGIEDIIIAFGTDNRDFSLVAFAVHFFYFGQEREKGGALPEIGIRHRTSGKSDDVIPISGVDGYDIPSFICTIYFKVPAPCYGGLLALDGITGETIWQHWAPHTVFSVDCASDVTGDFVKDCLATGRGGVFRVINGHDGSLVWHFQPQPTVKPASVDVFAGRFIYDIDGDGITDILIAHTKETSSHDVGTTQSGYILLVSGRHGRLLQRIDTPRGEESYYSPQLLVRSDGENVVLFGTGGHTTPGGLYVIPLQQLSLGHGNRHKVIYRDDFKGVMSPPILVDITQDGIEDIIVATFNSTIIAFDGETYKQIWNYSFPNSETYSSPTPGYFNDDLIPDFLVKYQTGPGFPVYFYSQTLVLDGRNGAPLLDKVVIDTVGTQTAGLSISIEGLGNDFILHWSADCLGHEKSQDPYAFVPGIPIHMQSRADICKLRFNSSLVSQLLAWSQHLEPAGTPIYSSDERRFTEYNNSVNASIEVEKYIQKHPDFKELYTDQNYLGKIPPYSISSPADSLRSGGSNFRHKDDPAFLPSNEQKVNDHFPTENFNVMNRGRNRDSSNRVLPGEGEEMSPSFSDKGDYPEIRKHGVDYSKHPPQNIEWQQQWQNPEIPDSSSRNVLIHDDAFPNVNSGGAYFENSLPNRDTDYDPVYDRSVEDGYNPLQGQRDERSIGNTYTRNKRETPNSKTVNLDNNFVPGIQRITSAGILSTPFGASKKNNSIDLIFATYWIYPSTDVQILSAKQLECIETNFERADLSGKFAEMDRDSIGIAVSKDCLGQSTVNSKLEPDNNPLYINMGQMTVYKLRLTCNCKSLGEMDKCSQILPLNQQSWSSGSGFGNHGYFKPRRVSDTSNLMAK